MCRFPSIISIFINMQVRLCLLELWSTQFPDGKSYITGIYIQSPHYSKYQQNDNVVSISNINNYRIVCILKKRTKLHNLIHLSQTSTISITYLLVHDHEHLFWRMFIISRNHLRSYVYCTYIPSPSLVLMKRPVIIAAIKHLMA